MPVVEPVFARWRSLSSSLSLFLSFSLSLSLSLWKTLVEECPQPEVGYSTLPIGEPVDRIGPDILPSQLPCVGSVDDDDDDDEMITAIMVMMMN